MSGAACLHSAVPCTNMMLHHVYFTDRYEQEMVEWLRENMDIFDDDDDDEDDSVEEEDCEVAKDDADDPSENNDIKIEPHLR